jgi:hypothetical protein
MLTVHVLIARIYFRQGKLKFTRLLGAKRTDILKQKRLEQDIAKGRRKEGTAVLMRAPLNAGTISQTT